MATVPPGPLFGKLLPWPGAVGVGVGVGVGEGVVLAGGVVGFVLGC
jgi:hypothetical protein